MGSEMCIRDSATVGKVDSDVVAHTESPLDEFGRMKAVVVGSP